MRDTGKITDKGKKSVASEQNVFDPIKLRVRQQERLELDSRRRCIIAGSGGESSDHYYNKRMKALEQEEQEIYKEKEKKSNYFRRKFLQW